MAFSDPDGQYKWRIMPFGILTARVFTKMVRLLQEPMKAKSITNFKDNVVVATENLEVDI